MRAYNAPQFLELETTVFDTDEFRSYTALVEALLTESKTNTFTDGRPRGLTITEINRSLGENAVPRWTYLALEWIDNLMHDGAPVRYRILDGPVRTAYRPQKNFTITTKKNEKAKGNR